MADIVGTAGTTHAATALALVRLERVMAASAGDPDVAIGLVDGPVDTAHPGLAGASTRTIGRAEWAATGPEARAHATFVAGILVGDRASGAPGVCPGCSLLVRPVFGAADPVGTLVARPDEVAEALVDCVEAGARVVNLSATTSSVTSAPVTALRSALDHVARRGAIVVAAAGDRGSVAGAEVTRHPGVVPVVGYGRDGRPTPGADAAASAARQGVGAPSDRVVSLAADGGTTTVASSTSFATAFVSGTIALLWSLFGTVDAATIRRAITSCGPRGGEVPPLLDADALYATLDAARAR